MVKFLPSCIKTTENQKSLVVSEKKLKSAQDKAITPDIEGLIKPESEDAGVKSAEDDQAEESKDTAKEE